MGKSGKSPKVSAKSDVVELSKRQAKAKAKKTAREKQKAAAQARIKHALGVKRAAQLENCVKYAHRSILLPTAGGSSRLLHGHLECGRPGR